MIERITSKHIVAYEMKKRLRQYGKSREGIDIEKKEVNISRLLEVVPPPRRKGNFRDFVWEQIGFLNRTCLVWQLLWLAIFCIIMMSNMEPLIGTGTGLILLSILPPLLVLLTIEEITKVYQRSMLEIEYTTKYSLQTLVMVRMMLLNGVHVVLLLVGLLIIHGSLQIGMIKILVYGFTPMLLATCGLLKLMQYFQGEQLKIAGMSVYVGIVAICGCGSIPRFDIYRSAFFGIWGMVLAVSICSCIYQFWSLYKTLRKMELVTQRG
ncbi:MAG: hypothetical protein K6G30_01745 [Acetatifactor sp.]|nr:hypothetical protein [Acetatifactor sp.]